MKNLKYNYMTIIRYGIIPDVSTRLYYPIMHLETF